MEDGYRKLTIKEKALKINLDQKIYGSFAEIGAGQEVAARFFKAGGASGTVAKTMSAYDMSFSDAIYGKSKRYVSEDRLNMMLDREYKLLNLRLSDRKANTNFFAFANTIETLNYKRTNMGHGWLGVKFQLTPNSEPNVCIIHVMLSEISRMRQQQAVGMVGVNLLYGCFFLHQDPEALLNSLVDDILPGRVEIDMFRMEGPDFKHVDNRLMSLKLVKNGLATAAMFDPKGNVLQPSEALYKKNVLVLRGRFRPVTKANLDMLTNGLNQFENEHDVDAKKMLVLTELTLTGLNEEGRIDEKDFLDRVDILCSLGQTVMISNFHEFYKLSNYLTSFTKKRRVGIILGIHTLEKVFQEEYYDDLKGGVLEAFGQLFARGVRLYVYPGKAENNGELETISSFDPPKNLKDLFNFLVANGKIVDVKGADRKVMHIVNDEVLEMVKCGKEGWEEMVPYIVSRAIKDNCLFDYPCEPEQLSKAKKQGD